jgi:MoaA/NifB/PqqE/SkfB family radical SAM enzyme
MTTERWLNIIDEAIALGCRSIQFIGGEPTLHPDLPVLISHAHSAGCTLIEVYTNGTMLTEELLEICSATRTHLAFSVYGANAQVHERVTGVPRSFDRTVEGMRQAVARSLPIRVGIIKMPENSTGCDDTLSFLTSLGISDVKVDFERGVGRGERNLINPDPYAQLCGACSDGKAAIDSAGDVFPCVFSRFARIGNVLHDPLQTILRRPELTAFRDRVRLDAEIKERRMRNREMAADACGPDVNWCRPEDESNCTPNCLPGYSPPSCDPSCSPYCNPNCNPFSGCDPKK